ncbi:MerR family transcriptional regulator [Pseudonocardia nematodicida]|uniref:MerR family transcriptional regulator n=1 Tax=Pseudonocardia nematodicida TaxID=1206997 RepID=A0ABV1KEY2_9PSEU
MDELMPIGRFSRLCWLSIKALRVYDEAGLLTPAHVDPYSGYRYYLPRQAGTARAIATLRSLDMPLAEIRAVVTESDQDRVRDLLDHHRTVLEQRLDRHRHMLGRVETFIRKGIVMTYEISTRDIPATDVVGTEFHSSPEYIGEGCSRAYPVLFGALAAAGATPAGPPHLLYHSVDDDGWRLEAAVPVTGTGGLGALPEGLTVHRVGGGRAAVTRHVGPYDELGIAYREVEAWIEAQGLASAGTCYDVYLNDPAEVAPDKLETEIVWPVLPA